MGIAGLIAGFLFSAQNSTFPPTTLLAVASVIFLISGYNAYNAIADKDIDAINKPHRPLPKGDLTVKEAKIASFIFFLIALTTAVFTNTTFLTVIAVATVLAVFYSLPPIHLKKRFALGTLTANILYTVFFPLAGWAIQPQNPVPIPLLLFLFFFGIGSATLKDFEDVPGDTHYGAKTLPATLGYNEAAIFTFTSFLFSIVILAFFIYTNNLAIKYATITILPILALANVYLLYVRKNADEAQNAFTRGILIYTLVEIAFATLAIVR